LHDNSDIAPPIQTDETAIVLFVFAQFYQTQNDPKLLHDFYEPMIVPMADFLSDFVNPKTGLPKPSYDLWEQQYTTTLYTTSVTCAALYVAANLADDHADTDRAVQWRTVADTMSEKARDVFYNTERKVFYKGLSVAAGGAVAMDETIDMSGIYGAFMYGLFAIDSDEVKNSIATAKSTFGFGPQRPGLPRFEADDYQSADGKPNWWPIISLWLAQYSLEVGDDALADSVINWVTATMRDTSALPEQVNPATGENVSVEPLAWSQAEYISTLLDTITEK
jgi:GH15 family glucan-1,4-alpha-glucosidase